MLKALKTLAVGAALAPFLVGSADAHDPHHTAGDGFLVYSAIVELGVGGLFTGGSVTGSGAGSARRRSS